ERGPKTLAQMSSAPPHPVSQFLHRDATGRGPQQLPCPTHLRNGWTQGGLGKKCTVEQTEHLAPGRGTGGAFDEFARPCRWQQVEVDSGAEQFGGGQAE